MWLWFSLDAFLKISPTTAMNHIKPINTLLLAAAILPLISVVFSERLITCGGRNDIHRLSCDIGVIRVQDVFYGRRDSETCSEGIPQHQLRNTNCASKGALHFVRKICDNRKVCEISKNDIRRPDPCRGTNKYVETTYTCLPAIHVIVCEHSMAILHCDVGQVINVYGAHFGRGDKAVCAYKQSERQIRNIWCSNPSNKVAQKCNGKNRCTIRANKSVFGEPCRGTYKYLELAYVCEYPSY